MSEKSKFKQNIGKTQGKIQVKVNAKINVILPSVQYFS